MASCKILLLKTATGLLRFRRDTVLPQIRTLAPKSRNDELMFKTWLRFPQHLAGQNQKEFYQYL